MNAQLTIFDSIAGYHLAEIGIELAVEHADQKIKDWKTLCWQHFLVWLRRKKRYQDEFMIEDFRKYLEDYGLLEMPPSKRAFGFISRRALKEGWIMFGGIKKCKNKTAHATPVNVWIRK